MDSTDFRVLTKEVSARLFGAQTKFAKYQRVADYITNHPRNDVIATALLRTVAHYSQGVVSVNVACYGRHDSEAQAAVLFVYEMIPPEDHDLVVYFLWWWKGRYDVITCKERARLAPLTRTFGAWRNTHATMCRARNLLSDL